jgi:hypothetical protein
VAKSRLPKSISKWVKKKKARIRREVLDSGEVKRKIKETIEKYLNSIYKRKPED